LANQGRIDFGRFSHDLLIGQFAGAGDTQSSSFIAAYDLATGKFDGLLPDASGKPLAINRIWDLSPGNVSPANSDAAASPAATVYFRRRTEARLRRVVWLLKCSSSGVDGREFAVRRSS
jgi:hypothetical protein